ncbi:cilia- and flagella-associated protein 47-like, partial [Hylobates moloch]|uniref:cilia- and flagella-associated protein 47-like n=1 Tax=Hylobates moloch TaxID=81572 RepID=UPI002676B176
MALRQPSARHSSVSGNMSVLCSSLAAVVILCLGLVVVVTLSWNLAPMSLLVNEIIVTLKFTSRFIRPAEASLLLISKPKNAARGITMAFALKGKVLDFEAIDIIKCKSPCYQLQEVTVNVKNPFHTAGDFSVILVESSTFVSSPTKLTESRQYLKHDDDMSSSGSDADQGCCDSSNVLHTSIKSTFLREFFCSMHTVHLGVKGTSSLELRFLPFNMHVRYCVIILSNKK